MEYIADRDYKYIMSKYHDAEKPFDTFQRFIRHDAVFDPATGMDGDRIKEQIMVQDARHKGKAHCVRKALAVAYVLDHTRISCDARDIFPAINAVDRPINATLMNEWKNEVFVDTIPEVEQKRSYYERSGIATIWPDYDHSVPVWERLFDLGFAGILKESKEAQELFAAKKEQARENVTEQENAFFEAIAIIYEAILRFTARLAALAKETPGQERMAEALGHLSVAAPDSFYEALLLDYLYFMISEHIEGLQVRSLSNFDRLFYPFYQKDLARGISKEQIRTDLAYFFLQFTAIGNYWNQPVFLGGCKEDESTVINELSYLFLDVYDRMGIYNPKIQIKYADNMPKDFVCKALDMIRRGNNCIVFVSDDIIRKALMRRGATPQQARNCNVKGCYEFSIQGDMGTGMNYTNLLKPLEYALHQGCDGVSGDFVGLSCKAAEEYESFEEFYAEYKRQLCYIVDSVVDVVNAFEPYLSYVQPQTMLSATYPSCLEKAKDALGGGSVSNSSGIAYGFLADIADSMTAVKKYVFDQKVLTLGEFRDILDANYVGHEKFRLKLLADRDKYGNNKKLPDFFAKDIAEFAANYICGRPNCEERGGSWGCSFHVARQSYDQGRTTAASPNGRLLGEELSKNCSPSMGMNRDGVTAAVLSVTKIDATLIPGDVCLDMGILPATVRGEDGLEAMYGILATFMKRGGHAVHINVFDAETLRAAQANPEQYRDLQIRVCGWNVLFNHINKVEQDGFIRQAESLI